MTQRTRRSLPVGSPLVWSLLLIISGLALLLNNFLLVEDLTITNLVPLLLVVVGATILMRGDLLSDSRYQSFGITRGSVESATLEINAGEIDVNIRSLQQLNRDRLIAGHYAMHSRPQLTVEDVHAHLRMNRNFTPWLSMVDWEIGLAGNLPWQLIVSTSLGQVNLNLARVILSETMVSTGIGDIQFICPYEALQPIYLQSKLGNIYVTAPLGHQVQLVIQPHRGHLLDVHVDEARYQADDHDVNAFWAKDAVEDSPLVTVYISGTFGNIYLS